MDWSITFARPFPAMYVMIYHGFFTQWGLDSRVLLAFFNELDHKDKFHTFTFGIPGCDDARFADQASN
jgi:hypothetical protein